MTEFEPKHKPAFGVMHYADVLRPTPDSSAPDTDLAACAVTAEGLPLKAVLIVLKDPLPARMEEKLAEIGCEKGYCSKLFHGVTQTAKKA